MKKVYFNLQDDRFHRYMYLFIKFLLIEGYTVYIKFNFKFLRSLSLYSRLLLKEKGVKPYTIIKPKNVKEFTDSKDSSGIYISPDYFSFTKETANNKSYMVPISMHPLMYANGLWSKPIQPRKRLKSALFIGATKGYANQSEIIENVFRVTNREGVLSYLIDKSFTVIPDSQSVFESFDLSYRVVIADRKDIRVVQDDLRYFLSKYYFFIAAPGYIMPLCHNLVEAMSVGVIPIVQRGYAELLFPKLEHEVNAIIFESIDELESRVKWALRLPEDKIQEMSFNVLNYYNEYLTPAKVVQRVMNGKYSNIYLNAEEGSVQLLMEKIVEPNNVIT